MKREIIFRGKTFKDNVWVEGCLLYPVDLWAAIAQKDGAERYNVEFVVFDVDPETVGQFTGLYDKNGKRIFEGDVVEGHCHSAWSHELQRCEVVYGRNGFEARQYVKCGEELACFTYKVLFSRDVVVIGNIHDNPELLKEVE